MSMVSKPRVPEGLRDLMKDLTKEILKEKPTDIYDFSENYFHSRLPQKENYAVNSFEKASVKYDFSYIKNPQPYQVPVALAYSIIPEALTNLIKDLIKAVLRQQPTNLCDFAVEYFRHIKVSTNTDSKTESKEVSYTAYESYFINKERFLFIPHVKCTCGRTLADSYANNLHLSPIQRSSNHESLFHTKTLSDYDIANYNKLSETDAKYSKKYMNAIYIIQRHFRRFLRRKNLTKKSNGFSHNSGEVKNGMVTYKQTDATCLMIPLVPQLQINQNKTENNSEDASYTSASTAVLSATESDRETSELSTSTKTIIENVEIENDEQNYPLYFTQSGILDQQDDISQRNDKDIIEIKDERNYEGSTKNYMENKLNVIFDEESNIVENESLNSLHSDTNLATQLKTLDNEREKKVGGILKTDSSRVSLEFIELEKNLSDIQDVQICNHEECICSSHELNVENKELDDSTNKDAVKKVEYTDKNIKSISNGSKSKLEILPKEIKDRCEEHTNLNTNDKNKSIQIKNEQKDPITLNKSDSLADISQNNVHIDEMASESQLRMQPELKQQDNILKESKIEETSDKIKLLQKATKTDSAQNGEQAIINLVDTETSDKKGIEVSSTDLPASNTLFTDNTPQAEHYFETDYKQENTGENTKYKTREGKSIESNKTADNMTEIYTEINAAVTDDSSHSLQNAQKHQAVGKNGDYIHKQTTSDLLQKEKFVETNFDLQIKKEAQSNKTEPKTTLTKMHENQIKPGKEQFDTMETELVKDLISLHNFKASCIELKNPIENIQSHLVDRNNSDVDIEIEKDQEPAKPRLEYIDVGESKNNHVSNPGIESKLVDNSGDIIKFELNENLHEILTPKKKGSEKSPNEFNQANEIMLNQTVTDHGKLGKTYEVPQIEHAATNALADNKSISEEREKGKGEPSQTELYNNKATEPTKIIEKTTDITANNLKCTNSETSEGYKNLKLENLANPRDNDKIYANDLTHNNDDSISIKFPIKENKKHHDTINPKDKDFEDESLQTSSATVLEEIENNTDEVQNLVLERNIQKSLNKSIDESTASNEEANKIKNYLQDEMDEKTLKSDCIESVKGMRSKLLEVEASVENLNKNTQNKQLQDKNTNDTVIDMENNSRMTSKQKEPIKTEDCKKDSSIINKEITNNMQSELIKTIDLDNANVNANLSIIKNITKFNQETTEDNELDNSVDDLISHDKGSISKSEESTGNNQSISFPSLPSNIFNSNDTIEDTSNTANKASDADKINSDFIVKDTVKKFELESEILQLATNKKGIENITDKITDKSKKDKEIGDADPDMIRTQNLSKLAEELSEESNNITNINVERTDKLNNVKGNTDTDPNIKNITPKDVSDRNAKLESELEQSQLEANKSKYLIRTENVIKIGDELSEINSDEIKNITVTIIDTLIADQTHELESRISEPETSKSNDMKITENSSKFSADLSEIMSQESKNITDDRTDKLNNLKGDKESVDADPNASNISPKVYEDNNAKKQIESEISQQVANKNTDLIKTEKSLKLSDELSEESTTITDIIDKRKDKLNNIKGNKDPVDADPSTTEAAKIEKEPEIPHVKANKNAVIIRIQNISKESSQLKSEENNNITDITDERTCKLDNIKTDKEIGDADSNNIADKEHGLESEISQLEANKGKDTKRTENSSKFSADLSEIKSQESNNITDERTVKLNSKTGREIGDVNPNHIANKTHIDERVNTDLTTINIPPKVDKNQNSKNEMKSEISQQEANKNTDMIRTQNSSKLAEELSEESNNITNINVERTDKLNNVKGNTDTDPNIKNITPKDVSDRNAKLESELEQSQLEANKSKYLIRSENVIKIGDELSEINSDEIKNITVTIIDTLKPFKRDKAMTDVDSNTNNLSDKAVDDRNLPNILNNESNLRNIHSASSIYISKSNETNELKQTKCMTDFSGQDTSKYEVVNKTEMVGRNNSASDIILKHEEDANKTEEELKQNPTTNFKKGFDHTERNKKTSAKINISYPKSSDDYKNIADHAQQNEAATTYSSEKSEKEVETQSHSPQNDRKYKSTDNKTLLENTTQNIQTISIETSSSLLNKLDNKLEESKNKSQDDEKLNENYECDTSAETVGNLHKSETTSPTVKPPQRNSLTLMNNKFIQSFEKQLEIQLVLNDASHKRQIETHTDDKTCAMSLKQNADIDSNISTNQINKNIYDTEDKNEYKNGLRDFKGSNENIDSENVKSSTSKNPVTDKSLTQQSSTISNENNLQTNTNETAIGKSEIEEIQIDGIDIRKATAEPQEEQIKFLEIPSKNSTELQVSIKKINIDADEKHLKVLSKVNQAISVVSKLQDSSELNKRTIAPLDKKIESIESSQFKNGTNEETKISSCFLHNNDSIDHIDPVEKNVLNNESIIKSPTDQKPLAENFNKQILISEEAEDKYKYEHDVEVISEELPNQNQIPKLEYEIDEKVLTSNSNFQAPVVTDNQMSAQNTQHTHKNVANQSHAQSIANSDLNNKDLGKNILPSSKQLIDNSANQANTTASRVENNFGNSLHSDIQKKSKEILSTFQINTNSQSKNDKDDNERIEKEETHTSNNHEKFNNICIQEYSSFSANETESTDSQKILANASNVDETEALKLKTAHDDISTENNLKRENADEENNYDSDCNRVKISMEAAADTKHVKEEEYVTSTEIKEIKSKLTTTLDTADTGDNFEQGSTRQYNTNDKGVNRNDQETTHYIGIQTPETHIGNQNLTIGRIRNFNEGLLGSISGQRFAETHLRSFWKEYLMNNSVPLSEYKYIENEPKQLARQEQISNRVNKAILSDDDDSKMDVLETGIEKDTQELSKSASVKNKNISCTTNESKLPTDFDRLPKYFYGAPAIPFNNNNINPEKAKAYKEPTSFIVPIGEYNKGNTLTAKTTIESSNSKRVSKTCDKTNNLIKFNLTGCAEAEPLLDAETPTKLFQELNQLECKILDAVSHTDDNNYERTDASNEHSITPEPILQTIIELSESETAIPVRYLESIDENLFASMEKISDSTNTSWSAGSKGDSSFVSGDFLEPQHNVECTNEISPTSTSNRNTVGGIYEFSKDYIYEKEIESQNEHLKIIAQASSLPNYDPFDEELKTSAAKTIPRAFRRCIQKRMKENNTVMRKQTPPETSGKSRETDGKITEIFDNETSLKINKNDSNSANENVNEIHESGRELYVQGGIDSVRLQKVLTGAIHTNNEATETFLYFEKISDTCDLMNLNKYRKDEPHLPIEKIIEDGDSSDCLKSSDNKDPNLYIEHKHLSVSEESILTESATDSTNKEIKNSKIIESVNFGKDVNDSKIDNETLNSSNNDVERDLNGTQIENNTAAVHEQSRRSTDDHNKSVVILQDIESRQIILDQAAGKIQHAFRNFLAQKSNFETMKVETSKSNWFIGDKEIVANDLMTKTTSEISFEETKPYFELPTNPPKYLVDSNSSLETIDANSFSRRPTAHVSSSSRSSIDLVNDESTNISKDTVTAIESGEHENKDTPPTKHDGNTLITSKTLTEQPSYAAHLQNISSFERDTARKYTNFIDQFINSERHYSEAVNNNNSNTEKYGNITFETPDIAEISNILVEFINSQRSDCSSALPDENIRKHVSRSSIVADEEIIPEASTNTDTSSISDIDDTEDSLSTKTVKLHEPDIAITKMQQRREATTKVSLLDKPKDYNFDEPSVASIDNLDADEEVIVLNKLQRESTCESSGQSETDVIIGSGTFQDKIDIDETFPVKGSLKRVYTIASESEAKLLLKNVTIDESIRYIEPSDYEVSSGSLCLDTETAKNIRRNIMAYSLSEADSDYFEKNTNNGESFSLELKTENYDDFNVRTALIENGASSTDTESSIVSAVTKIQAGARGYLTRKRLEKASAASNKKSIPHDETNEASFGNAAINESLEHLVQEAAAKKIQTVYRAHCRKKLAEVKHKSDTSLSPKLDTTKENSLAQKRSTMLQRGLALCNNTTPDEGNSRSSGSGNKNCESLSIHHLADPLQASSVKTAAEMRAKKIKENKTKWLAMRQNSMPVQIDSEVLRVIPKHMRKKIKSAEGEKKKNRDQVLRD